MVLNYPLFLFTKAIVNGRAIQVFDHGKMERDFTYIDEITEGVVRVLETPFEGRKAPEKRYKVYNIGNNKAVNRLDFIDAIETSLGKKAEKEWMPVQPGDVARTWADVDALIRDYGCRPQTPVTVGVQHFVDWYRSFYQIK